MYCAQINGKHERNKKIIIILHSRQITLVLFGFFFSSSFQISDWLNLDQNMAKNYHVDVGDIDAITEAINKQKVSTFLWTLKFCWYLISCWFFCSHHPSITDSCPWIGKQKTTIGRIDFGGWSSESRWKSPKVAQQKWVKFMTFHLWTSVDDWTKRTIGKS